jgi:hypothetical protein
MGTYNQCEQIAILLQDARIVPLLRRLRQKDCEFKTRLDYIVRLCLKEKTNKQGHFVYKFAEGY